MPREDSSSHSMSMSIDWTPWVRGLPTVHVYTIITITCYLPTPLSTMPPMSCHASTVSQLVNAPQSSINSTYNQQSARWMVDQLAVSLQAALLILHGDHIVAELYVRSRLPSCSPPDHHHHHGSGVPSTTIRGVTYGGTMVFEEQHCAHLIERSMPVFMTS